MANRELFGTDGVRGLAGKYPLDDQGIVAIGRAVGSHFAQPGEKVVLGWDPRESSTKLVEGISKGLISVGIDVTKVGVLPTPGLAYLTREVKEFRAGIMITASHNPVEYNGVKVFDADGGKLTDETEEILNKLIVNGVEERGSGQAAEELALAQRYEDFLVASADGLKLDGLPLAIDSANGAASGLAARVFERLGAAVAPLFAAPNGRNINDGCGATDPTALIREMKSLGSRAGVALDGDADRLVMIDELGRPLDGDQILYILAVTGRQPGIVVTGMTNLGLENALKAKGINVERVAVGDRYVLEGLKQTGYVLGGEQSGHIIIYDRLATGDALLAAIRTLVAVTGSGKSLAQWRDEVPLLPQALVNITLEDKSRLDEPAIKAYIDSQAQELGANGRLLIRPSGTEPLARVMVEAPDAEARANRIAAKLKELL